MSLISKLQIRGIRSFGPDQDENIEFYSPLTMIVGQNGCGKTTIIESLKFACTGLMPPNAQKGQSFVNDPGMTDTAEVKAHIKLLFKNRGGKDCLAIRSLQVTKKKKKLEFKALEGVIKTTNDDNQQVSLPFRCSDMDRMIPENLGVSPAILENVIFVHQEESNWPLQEGAVLKKKFDDVFESTRYTKALEALAKTKKDTQAKAKELKADLGELSGHLAAATMSRKELQDNQSNEENCETELSQINERLETTEGKLRDITTALEQARERQGALEKLQWKLKEAERRIQDKGSSIETLLSRESDDELRAIMNNFSNEMEKRQKELQQVNRQVDNFKQEMEGLQQNITQLNVKKGQGEFLKQDIHKVKVDLIANLQGLSRKYHKLTPFTTSLTVASWNSRIARDVLNVLNQEFQTLQEEHQAQVQSQRNQLQEMEKSCQELTAKVSKLDMEMNYKTEESRGITTDIEKKRSELLKLTSSRALLTTKQQDFEEAQRGYDDFMQQFQIKSIDIKKQTKDVTDELHQLQEQITQDSRMLQELSFHRQEMTTLEVQSKNIDQDKLEVLIDIENLFTANRDGLMKSSIATKWTNPADLLNALKTVAGLDEVNTKWQSEVQQSQQKFKSSQQQFLQMKSDGMTKETLYNQARDRLQQLRPKLNTLQDYHKQLQACIQRLNALRTSKTLSDCDDLGIIPMDRKLEDVLQDAKKTEDEAREMLIIEKSGKSFLKRLRKYRQQNPNKCPCCLQGMTAPDVVQQYEQRIQAIFSLNEGNTMDELQATLDDCKKIFNTLQDLQQKMLPLLALQSDVTDCEQEIADLQQQRAQIDKNISDLGDEVQVLEDQAQVHSKLQTTLQDLLFRFKQVEQKRLDLQDRKRRQQQSLLAATSSSAMSLMSEVGAETEPFRNLDELEKQVQRQLEHKDSLQAKKEKLALEESNLMKKSYALKSLLSDREKALNDAKLDGNRAGEIEASLTTLQSKVSDIEARKQVVIREKEGLLRQLQEQKSSLQTKKTECEQRETASNGRLNSLKADRDDCNRNVESCEELERKLQDVQLAQIETQLQDLQRRLQEQKTRLQDEWNPRIQELQQALASQEQTKRNVAQNIELRQLQQELQTLQADCEQMQKLYGGGQGQQEFQKLKQQQEQLQRDKQNWSSQYHQINGKLAVYSQNIKELQKKLSSGLYRDIESKYRVKNIEFETTNIAVVDLTNYYNAL
jgi:DNA repair protein RAD50